MPGTDSDNLNDLSAQEDLSRDYGPQPLAALLEARGLTNHQLVAASTEQLTHKMVAKACRGRYLSGKVRQKILRAFCKLTGEVWTLAQLFNYR